MGDPYNAWRFRFSVEDNVDGPDRVLEALRPGVNRPVHAKLPEVPLLVGPVVAPGRLLPVVLHLVPPVELLVHLSLIYISEPTSLLSTSYAVFCL